MVDIQPQPTHTLSQYLLLPTVYTIQLYHSTTGICSGMPQGKPNTQPQHIVATFPLPHAALQAWKRKVEVGDVVKIKAHYTF